MTAQEIRDSYRHDQNGRITQPGKFEGEPIFAPYFWAIAMEGFADRDDGKVFTFRLAFGSSADDQKLAMEWPELKTWLGHKRTLKMYEDDQGFVHCF